MFTWRSSSVKRLTSICRRSARSSAARRAFSASLRSVCIDWKSASMRRLSPLKVVTLTVSSLMRVVASFNSFSAFLRARSDYEQHVRVCSILCLGNCLFQSYQSVACVHASSCLCVPSITLEPNDFWPRQFGTLVHHGHIWVKFKRQGHMVSWFSATNAYYDVMYFMDACYNVT